MRPVLPNEKKENHEEKVTSFAARFLAAYVSTCRDFLQRYSSYIGLRET